MKMHEKLIIDSKICLESEMKLKELGFDIIKIPENPRYPKPVCSHPDMFCLKIKDAFIIDDAVKDLFTFVDEKIIVNREDVGNKIIEYPNDVGLNCAVVGNNLICNTKITSSKVLELAENSNMNVVNVNQGYAKCSICIVDSNSIITEDLSITNAAKKHGIDVLTIQKGQVSLCGYNYGFIGGASGLLNENLLAFNGNITLHTDYSKIKKFCHDRNVEILCLNNRELYDIGSILRI